MTTFEQIVLYFAFIANVFMLVVHPIYIKFFKHQDETRNINENEDEKKFSVCSCGSNCCSEECRLRNS